MCYTISQSCSAYTAFQRTMDQKGKLVITDSFPTVQSPLTHQHLCSAAGVKHSMKSGADQNHTGNLSDLRVAANGQKAVIKVKYKT